MTEEKKLGSLESSESLIRDLYIDLRKKINSWAEITHQTAQARMGYVGQHLVSITTGYLGGKSGARGKDLIIDENDVAEIKTCYRVDQLGKCNNCGIVVASIETECSNCESTNIKRNEDSKWLIGIRHDDEFSAILDPKYYYLVLFDFIDFCNPNTIRASIWKVDSIVPGFAYCMIDYYLNIRTKSKSKASFNLWPFQLKFDMMKAKLIYRSHINSDDTIKTIIFPGRDEYIIRRPNSMSHYSRARNLTLSNLFDFADDIGCNVLGNDSKKELITKLDKYIKDLGGFEDHIIDSLAKSLYWNRIKLHIESLPKSLKEKLKHHNLI